MGAMQSIGSRLFLEAQAVSLFVRALVKVGSRAGARRVRGWELPSLEGGRRGVALAEGIAGVGSEVVEEVDPTGPLQFLPKSPSIVHEPRRRQEGGDGDGECGDDPAKTSHPAQSLRARETKSPRD